MLEAKEIKHIIAVSSGKGGVGKSTVSANLAVALSREGYRTGLLDVDVYGPSIPLLFGCEAMRPETDDHFIFPVHKFGVELMSLGFFLLPNQPVIWRGAMAVNAVQQLFTEVAWGALDYLIIDMPPGTGDIALTVVQNIPLAGVVIVTTPQNVALHDVRKTVAMFQNENINIPILGVVENMSWFTPQELPENKYYIFGKEGGKNLAAELSVSLLAQIPLIQSVAESGDKGTPAATYGEQPIAQAFMQLADKIFENINPIKTI
jgi:ATP-binding protein involved in chromosome partitioning